MPDPCNDFIPSTANWTSFNLCDANAESISSQAVSGTALHCILGPDRSGSVNYRLPTGCVKIDDCSFWGMTIKKKRETCTVQCRVTTIYHLQRCGEGRVQIVSDISWPTLQSFWYLLHTSLLRPPDASQGLSGGTMLWLTRADRWVRTVDRCRQ